MGEYCTVLDGGGEVGWSSVVGWEVGGNDGMLVICM